VRRGGGHERVALLGLRDTDGDVGGDARGGELRARLLGVPAVGDEEHGVAVEEHEAGRPGETGEIADVGQPGDEERVDSGAREAGADTVGACADVHRGEVGEPHRRHRQASSFDTAASTARR
jgi:hypothetical protein